jgi:hypothetical protein
VIDRVVRWVERLPGTGVPWIFGFSLLLGILAHVPAWTSGELPAGTLIQDEFAPVWYMAYFLSLIDVFDGIARATFEEFRPALDVSAEEAGRLVDELTSIPGRQALAATAIFAVIINAGFLLDPGSPSEATPLPESMGIANAALWLLAILALALVVVHTIQQLSLVRRLHAMATHVDLLLPGPTNAFSILTAATAVGIIIIGILFAAPETQGVSAFGLASGLAFTALAVASFGLPLAGMHGRLAAEQSRLMGDVNARLKAVLARIHQTVDADDSTRATELQATESALLAERDLYARLSTWPWSPGTLRGFLSALLLPILIGVTLRVLSRFV